MKKLKIKKVEKDSDIIKCWELIYDVSIYMENELKQFNWSPPISLEYFKNSLIDKELFIGYFNDIPIATFNLAQSDEGYTNKIWEDVEDSVILSKLAIHPKYQSKGFGKICLDFIELYCRKINIKSILLDTLATNKKLTNFYVEEGFCLVGNKDIVSKRGNKWNINLFKKIIDVE